MFDIRFGHPLISRFLFLLFSLASVFVVFFFISFIGSISSVLFLLWLVIVSHVHLLPSTAPGISVFKGF